MSEELQGVSERERVAEAYRRVARTDADRYLAALLDLQKSIYFMDRRQLKVIIDTALGDANGE